MYDEKKNRSKEQGKYLRIKHVLPEDQVTHFTNHLVIQHTSQGEFYLLFFEVLPPPVFGDPDEARQEFENMETIEAKCVARLVVTKERMSSIIAALADSYRKLVEKEKSAKPKPEQEEESND